MAKKADFTYNHRDDGPDPRYWGKKNNPYKKTGLRKPEKNHAHKPPDPPKPEKTKLEKTKLEKTKLEKSHAHDKPDPPKPAKTSPPKQGRKAPKGHRVDDPDHSLMQAHDRLPVGPKPHAIENVPHDGIYIQPQIVLPKIALPQPKKRAGILGRIFQKKQKEEKAGEKERAGEKEAAETPLKIYNKMMEPRIQREKAEREQEAAKIEGRLAEEEADADLQKYMAASQARRVAREEAARREKLARDEAEKHREEAERREKLAREEAERRKEAERREKLAREEAARLEEPLPAIPIGLPTQPPPPVPAKGPLHAWKKSRPAGMASQASLASSTGTGVTNYGFDHEPMASTTTVGSAGSGFK